MSDSKCKVSKNKAVAEALEKLASFVDDNKVNPRILSKTFLTAADAIRECDFEITSGEMISSSKKSMSGTKLHGIGTTVGEMVDDFLKTGQMSHQKINDHMAKEG